MTQLDRSLNKRSCRFRQELDSDTCLVGKSVSRRICRYNRCLRHAVFLGLASCSANVGAAMVLREPSKVNFDSSPLVPSSLPILANWPRENSALSSIQIIRFQRLKRMRTSEYPLFNKAATETYALKASEWTRALFDEDISNLDDVLKHVTLLDEDDTFRISSSTPILSTTTTTTTTITTTTTASSTTYSQQQDDHEDESHLKTHLQRSIQRAMNNTPNADHGHGDDHGDNKRPFNNNHSLLETTIIDQLPHEREDHMIQRKTNQHSSDSINRINSKELSTLLAAKKNWIDSQQTLRGAPNSIATINPNPHKHTIHTTPDSTPIQTIITRTNTQRLTQEEEIELGKVIQQGAHLHRIKAQFEQVHGRDITRSEWVQLAQLQSPKELRRLVSDYRLAKNTLVMANMGLVHGIVRNRLGSWSNPDRKKTKDSSSRMLQTSGNRYDEMIQEGSLGLLRAAELFDPSRGLRFSTYATIWIKGILSNSNTEDTITLPLREKNKFNKIKNARDDLMTEHQTQNASDEYSPSIDEVANKCGMSKQEVVDVMSKMTRAKNVLSLDYQYDGTSRSGSDTVKFNALANDKSLMDDVDLVERLQLRADVVATLVKNLDRRESRLMKLRYGLDDGKARSIAECAEEMGISKARAQQLAAGCLKKLREADDAESLQEYLQSI